MALARNWLFTLFGSNVETVTEETQEYHWDLIRQAFENHATFIAGQFEICPKTSKKHFQGYMQLNRKRRITALKKIHPTAHYEARKGTHQDAINYVTKEHTRLYGPWKYGEGVEERQRTDIQKMVRLLHEGKTPHQVTEEYPEQGAHVYKFLEWKEKFIKNEPEFQGAREVIVFQGPPGCGKSRLVREREGRENLYNLFSKSPLWFDGYQREPVLLINEFNGEIPVEKINELCDRKEYDIRVPIKGHSILARWNKVYICTNTDINYWWTQALPSQIDAFKRRITEHKTEWNYSPAAMK